MFSCSKGHFIRAYLYYLNDLMYYEFYYFSGLSTSYFVDITHIESLAFHENGSIEKIVTKGFVKKCQKLVIYMKLDHVLLYEVNCDQILLENQLRFFFLL